MSTKPSVLVTGDKGYIGTVLTAVLLERGYRVSGLDTGYFADCVLEEPSHTYPSSRKDIRDVTAEDVRGVDAVVHLAALSNDPLGEFQPALTTAINLDGRSAWRPLRRPPASRALSMRPRRACTVSRPSIPN